MLKQCPKCGSQQIESKDVAKKYCGLIGMAGGAFGGLSSTTVGATVGANIGSKVGIVGGPSGMVVGTFFGAFLGVLVGAATGGTAGAKLGKTIDYHVLNNFKCRCCKHYFSVSEGDGSSVDGTDD